MQSEVLANSIFCVKGSNEVDLKIIQIKFNGCRENVSKMGLGENFLTPLKKVVAFY
jgi:hypothetical protein